MPEFEAAAYALAKGQVSAPVKSPVGYHIIKLIDRKPLEPYDTLRAPIRRYLEQGGVRDRLCKQKVDSVAAAEGLSAQEVMDREADRLCQQDSDLAFLVQEYHDGLLLFEISSREVWEPAKRDTAGLENYFKLHRTEFKWGKPHYRGIAFSCKDKKQVKAVQKLLKKTPYKDWVPAVRREFNKDSVTVRMDQKVFVKGQNSIVDALAFKVKDAKVKENPKFPYNGVFGKMLKKGPEEWGDVAKSSPTTVSSARCSRRARKSGAMWPTRSSTAIRTRRWTPILRVFAAAIPWSSMKKLSNEKRFEDIPYIVPRVPLARLACTVACRRGRRGGLGGWR